MNDGCKSKPGLARVGAYAALLLLALRVVPAAGGVVITQELVMPDADGGTKNVTHTMMIEGDRLKTISAEGIAIMDLDKGTLTVLDAKNKTATEMPLGNVLSPMAAGFTGKLKPTGKQRKVAGYSCEVFTNDFMSAGGEVSSTSCISKDAPGAAEAAAFYKKMGAKAVGHDVEGVPDGVSLSEETSVQPSATPAQMRCWTLTTTRVARIRSRRSLSEGAGGYCRQVGSWSGFRWTTCPWPACPR